MPAKNHDRVNISVLIGLQIAIFLSALDQTVLNIAIPKMGVILNDVDRAPWIITSYLLFATVATPVAGRLSDIYGVKSIVSLACALFTAASLLCGSAASMDQLLLFRALQGTAGGAMIGLCFIAIGDLFPVRQRGRYQGFLAAAFIIAAIIGPSLGGWLMEAHSWRTIFYINVIPGLVATLLLAAAYPIDSGSLEVEKKASIDFLLIPSVLFKQKVVLISLITVSVTGIGLFGSTLILSTILQNEVGMSALSTGMELTPLMLLVAGASVIGGLWISKTGHWKNLILLSLLLMLIGTVLLSTFSGSSPAWLLFLYATIGGAGLGLMLPIHTIVIQNSVDRSVMGVATSMTQFFRSLGGTLGTGFMGAVTASLMKTTSLQSAISIILLIYAGILAVVIVLNLFLKEVALDKPLPSSD